MSIVIDKKTVVRHSSIMFIEPDV